MLNGKTKIAGVIGWPIAHSQSPRLHNFWLQELSLNGVYIPLEVHPSDIIEAFKSLPKLGFSGVNITVPYKEQICDILDHIDPFAARVGAVNTIVIGENGQMFGTNSDGFGFLENVKQSIPLWDPIASKVVVVGAGGATRSIIASLIDVGVTNIRIVNRTFERAKVLVEQINYPIEIFSWHNIDDAIIGSNFFINTTTLGMYGQPPLLCDLTKLAPDAIVTDIVYSPLTTPLLSNAKKLGFAVVDGLGMLLHQARPGFKSWFGYMPEVSPKLRSFIIEGIGD